MVLLNNTTSAAAVILSADTSAPTLTGQTINVLTLLATRTFQVKAQVVARRTDVDGEAAGWDWSALVARDSTGNARIVGNPVYNTWGDTNAAAWDLSFSIDTTDATNNYLKLTATGEASKTIRWVARLDWVEVG
jgi:hypothetical protein